MLYILRFNAGKGKGLNHQPSQLEKFQHWDVRQTWFCSFFFSRWTVNVLTGKPVNLAALVTCVFFISWFSLWSFMLPIHPPQVTPWSCLISPTVGACPAQSMQRNRFTIRIILCFCFLMTRSRSFFCYRSVERYHPVLTKNNIWISCGCSNIFLMATYLPKTEDYCRTTTWGSFGDISMETWVTT